MPDPFDDARRALNEVPVPDLWDEAQGRAAGGSVEPLPVGDGRPHHPVRWLAVAALAALAIGTVAVLADEDDQSVDTSPRATPPSTTEDGMVDDGLTIIGPDGCRIGMSGDDVRVESGPAEPPRFDPTGQPPGQLVYHLPLGASQLAELHVPGVVVRDLVGERVEDVELERGTAQLWLGTDFVQVRWFNTSQEPCSSFTVTVSGGDEDANRHAAVDLADRMLVGSEVSDPSLRHTRWQLERSMVGGVTTEVTGLTFSFGLTEVEWSDGCNTFISEFEQADPAELVLVDGITSTKVFCDPNPTSDAIAGVMSADLPIDVSHDGHLATLTVGSIVLVLGPIDDTGGGGGNVGRDVPYAVWPMTAPEAILGYLPEFTGTPEEMALSFAREVLEWPDAVVTDREPSEDGSSGAVYLVASAATGGVAEIWVRPGEPDDLNVVYKVEIPGRLADPEAAASVSSVGTSGRAGVAPVPEGTVSSTVRFTYGENRFEGRMGEDIELYDRASWDGEDVAGAVLILFRDASGNVIGAWGVALPAGDFAAG